jgi:hypothetical protein
LKIPFEGHLKLVVGFDVVGGFVDVTGFAVVLNVDEDLGIVGLTVDVLVVGGRQVVVLIVVVEGTKDVVLIVEVEELTVDVILDVVVVVVVVVGLPVVTVVVEVDIVVAI